MSLSPAFTVTQSSISPQNVTLTNTSTGSDPSITAIRVYVSDAYGNYLSGNGTINYTTWSYSDSTITLSILTQDTAANIRLDFVDIDGNVIATIDNNFPLSEFGKQFFYYLVQLQGLKPSVYWDADYVNSMCMFWLNVVGGDNAIDNGNDLAAAQNCYNREIYMMNNQDLYF